MSSGGPFPAQTFNLENQMPPIDPNSPPPQPSPSPSSGSPPPIADPNASPPAPVEHWGKSWHKEDGTFDHAALAKLPDELKPLAAELANFKNENDFLKSFRELRTMASKKGIVDPLPDNATPEQKAERATLLRRAAGAPEKPEGYGIVKPEDLAPQYWDQKYADSMAAIMHKHGVGPEAAKELLAGEVQYAKQAIEGQQRAIAAELERQDKLIRDTAGKEGMDYNQAAEFAKRAALRFGISPENPVMKNASVLLAMARVGKLLGEDKLVTGDTNDFNLAANMTLEAAEKAALDIQTNKNNPDYAAYWNKDGKASEEAHKAAADKVRKYRMIAHANRPQRTGR